MASIKMIPENEAVGRVKTIYEEIKRQFGIDFVPNLYRVMATNPDYLEANWNKVKAVMFASGKLDRLTKEIIAVAVSAVQGCRY
jgi:alkylhydroperoxidase/carboxymuconolactone decarboxylase family protein YurZ